MVVEIVAPHPSLVVSREGRAPVALEVVARLLSGLNREQRRAVTHGDGPQLVIAGPGTGKTEVVTRRVAWLIATGRARPREILALTFTDNAAEEMQARVDLLLPYGQSDAHIHTFHAFGDRLLREYAFELGLAGDVRLISRAEAVVLMRDNLFELGLDRFRPLGDPTRFLEALADLFGRAKDEGVGPEDLAAHAARISAGSAGDVVLTDLAATRSELATAYGRYQQLLARRGLIDHGDQLALALQLLTRRPAVRGEVVGRYRHLLVDEFQDMNRAQVEMVLALTGPSRNVTVVGDPDQAIYNFRGAASDSIARFEQAHPRLRTVVLRTNYRSHAPVIQSAWRLVGHSRPEDGARPAARPVAHRRPRRPKPVSVVTFATPEEEADGIAAAVARRIESGERAADFAILTRSNAELGPLVRNLTFRGVPVRTHARSDFYAQPAVRPLLALLRVIADPHQTVELYVMATGWPYMLGGEELTTLLAAARRRHSSLWEAVRESIETPAPVLNGSFSAVARRLVSDVEAAVHESHERPAAEVLYGHLRRTGRLTRLATDPDQREAAAVARFFDVVRDRAALLADARVTSLVPHLDALIEAEDDQSDAGPLDTNSVSVLTVHRAKGLEFRVVYLTGLSDGRFPARGRPTGLDLPWHEIRGDSDGPASDRLDEERRLCFVAMTRARDELWLSHHMSGPGGRGTRRPSLFLAEAMDAAPSTPAAAQPLARSTEIPAPSPVLPPPNVARHSPSSFSFSQLEEYIDCPERYRLRHVVGLPTPPHHALSYGRALHSAVAFFHLEARRGTPPSLESVIDAFDRAWTPEGFLSREHEEARYATGRRALERFVEQQAAEPAPVAAIERPFEFALEGTRIRGRMDRVDVNSDGTVIVDYKSSDVRDQRRADEKARDSLQLQVYALAHQAASGTLPTEMQLHFLDSGVVGRTRPDGERLERARGKVRTAVDGIAAGSFPAKPNPVACGYCPFRTICPKSAA